MPAPGTLGRRVGARLLDAYAVGVLVYLFLPIS